MTAKTVAVITAFITMGGSGLSNAQQNLYIMDTTIPREAEIWYQEHHRDSLRPSFEIEFAGVYSGPSTDSDLLGHLWTVADWEPYLHMSWVYRSAASSESIVWREDVGDWGYGIEQFVWDTVGSWVQLPPMAFGDSVWVRVVGYGESNGFQGSVSSISDRLIHLDGVVARALDSARSDTITGTVLIESITHGIVTFRPEVPSDMPCGDDIPPDPEVSHYSATTGAFVTDARQPRFRIAYPKGC